MIDPVSGLAAKAIIDLAFNEFTKAASIQIAKDTASAASSFVGALRQKIVGRFKGNSRAEKAIGDITRDSAEKGINKLSVYLEDEMADDPEFSKELQALATQALQYMGANNTQNLSGDIKYQGDIYGGKQINVIQPIQGSNQKINQNFGDTYNSYKTEFSSPKYTFERLIGSLIRKHEYLEYIDPHDVNVTWSILTDPIKNSQFTKFEIEILKLLIRFCYFHKKARKDPEAQKVMSREDYYELARHISRSGKLNSSNIKLSSAIRDSEMSSIIARIES